MYIEVLLFGAFYSEFAFYTTERKDYLHYNEWAIKKNIYIYGPQI